MSKGWKEKAGDVALEEREAMNKKRGGPRVQATPDTSSSKQGEVVQRAVMAVMNGQCDMANILG